MVFPTNNEDTVIAGCGYKSADEGQGAFRISAPKRENILSSFGTYKPHNPAAASLMIIKKAFLQRGQHTLQTRRAVYRL